RSGSLSCVFETVRTATPEEPRHERDRRAPPRRGPPRTAPRLGRAPPPAARRGPRERGPPRPEGVADRARPDRLGEGGTARGAGQARAPGVRGRRRGLHRGRAERGRRRGGDRPPGALGQAPDELAAAAWRYDPSLSSQGVRAYILEPVDFQRMSAIVGQLHDGIALLRAMLAAASDEEYAAVVAAAAAHRDRPVKRVVATLLLPEEREW